jgi:hypothetical protein
LIKRPSKETYTQLSTHVVPTHKDGSHPHDLKRDLHICGKRPFNETKTRLSTHVVPTHKDGSHPHDLKRDLHIFGKNLSTRPNHDSPYM